MTICTSGRFCGFAGFSIGVGMLGDTVFLIRLAGFNLGVGTSAITWGATCAFFFTGFAVAAFWVFRFERFCTCWRLQLASERERQSWRSSLVNAFLNSLDGDAACSGPGITVAMIATAQTRPRPDFDKNFIPIFLCCTAFSIQ